MRRDRVPERTATIEQGSVDAEDGYDDREELHVIPRDYGVSVSVYELRYGGYNPEAGIGIEWGKVDEVIAALTAAKAHRPAGE